MKKNLISKLRIKLPNSFFWLVIILVFSGFLYFGFLKDDKISYAKNDATLKLTKLPVVPVLPPLDKVEYDRRMNVLANVKPVVVIPVKPKIDPKTGQPIISTNTEKENPIPPKPNLWPVKTVYPNAGAILPFNRIVAYYGNLLSTQMGVLGEYPENEMLGRLKEEVKKWELADPMTPVVPALHYIAVTAQASAGADGKYRLRMPDSEIDKVLRIAAKTNAIVFLDLQVGFSTVQIEIPRLEKYLKMPQVHLGIDPEFSMKTGIKPGKIVGTLDAEDINFAANYLAKIVKDNNLPPKILIIHRYTGNMVTNYKNIQPLPEVQIIMDMDGWGVQAKKINTYQQFIYKEPVQFAGFKLFYKEDIHTPGTVLMTPESVLKLSPQPSYIQYQ